MTALLAVLAALALVLVRALTLGAEAGLSAAATEAESGAC